MVTLGIDSSTQGAKAVVYDAGAGKVVASAGVNYGRDLPEFGSPEGFLPNADPRVRRANPEMWVRGLELVLRRLNDSGAPMGEIAAVGGCAQQHATVCLGEGGDFNTVCVTGGASRSKGILSAVGDIFGAEVKTLDATDSAAIGGARLAAMAVHDRGEAK